MGAEVHAATNAGPPGVDLDFGRIAQDIPCRHCGYNLRGLPQSQVCPECGVPVQASLHVDQLHFSDPRWLKRLWLGMICIQIGAIGQLAGVWGAGSWFARNLGMQRFPWNNGGWLADRLYSLWCKWNVSGVAFILIVFGVSVVGTWLTTSAEPRPTAASPRSRTRIASRILTAAFFLLILMAMGRDPAWKLEHLGDKFWHSLHTPISGLLAAAAWMTFCTYIRPLAERTDASLLARLTLPAGIGLAALSLVSATALLSMFLHLNSWLRYWSPAFYYFLCWHVKALLSTNAIVLTLQQALVLLLAVSYGRLFRRQVRLGQDILQSSHAGAA